MKITIVGAGNMGLALTAYLSLKDFDVTLFTTRKIETLKQLVISYYNACSLDNIMRYYLRCLIFSANKYRHEDKMIEASIQEAENLIKDGVVQGGMIPKVECCIDALEHGVKNVVIMDGRVSHSILIELLTNEGAGTMVKGEK